MGAASRNRVADPGWGAPSNAPDWAQPTDSPSGSSRPSGHSSQAPAVEAPSPAPLPEVVPVVNSGTTTSAPEQKVEPAVSVEAASSIDTAQPASPGDGGAKMSMYQRLSNSPEAQAGRVQAPLKAADTPHVQDVPSPDDVTIEESGVVGQAAVERILGGALVEERPLNGSN